MKSKVIEDFRTGETLKRCAKCGQYKKLTEYHTNNAAKHGVTSRCRLCTNQAARKYKNYSDRFWKSFYKRVERVGDCLEWQGGYKDKYRKTPCCKWHRKMVNVRRIVYELAIGSLSNDSVVGNTCGNYRCVRQLHLISMTLEEASIKRQNNAVANEKHPYRLRPHLHARGERVGVSKLTADQVRQIRSLYETTATTKKKLSRDFGVSDVMIGNIVKRRSWKHIE